MIRAVAARMRSAGSPCKTPGNRELSTAISDVSGSSRNPGAVKDSLKFSSTLFQPLFLAVECQVC
jgi:hypothetical protein